MTETLDMETTPATHIHCSENLDHTVPLGRSFSGTIQKIEVDGEKYAPTIMTKIGYVGQNVLGENGYMVLVDPAGRQLIFYTAIPSDATVEVTYDRAETEETLVEIVTDLNRRLERVEKLDMKAVAKEVQKLMGHELRMSGRQS